MQAAKREEVDDSVKLLWPLESRPGNLRSCVYAFQWFALSIVQIGVIAIIVGPFLGLDQIGIATLNQRIFFFSGAVTLLQVKFGHRLPVIEGPASMWWVTFISLATVSLNLGQPMSQIRTDLMGTMIAAGIFLFLFGVSGIVGKIKQFFTPAVTGCAFIMLTIQISRTFVSGILGITESNPHVDPLVVAGSLATIAVVIAVSHSRAPFLRSINLLVGLAAGWLFFMLLHREPLSLQAGLPYFNYPQLFQWGAPTFNFSMVTTGLMMAFILIAANVASTTAVARVSGTAVDEKLISRSIACNGFGNFLAGIGSSVGMTTLAASAGVIKLSGVASRKPVIIYCFLLMSVGFLPHIGIILSQIPRSVGYAVMLVAFTQILVVGLQDVKKMGLTKKDSFVLGIPIIVVIGLVSLPPANFENLPALFRYVLGNGMFTGLLICILLEHVFLRKSRA